MRVLAAVGSWCDYPERTCSARYLCELMRHHSGVAAAQCRVAAPPGERIDHYRSTPCPYAACCSQPRGGSIAASMISYVSSCTSPAAAPPHPSAHRPYWSRHHGHTRMGGAYKFRSVTRPQFQMKIGRTSHTINQSINRKLISGITIRQDAKNPLESWSVSSLLI